MRRHLVIFLSVLFAAIPCAASVSGVSLAERARVPLTIGVGPRVVEVELRPEAKSESIRVFNLGYEPAEVRVTVHGWELDEKMQVRFLETTEHSLDSWMLIDPLAFTIPAGGSQLVQFSIHPTVNPDPGEHRAVIYFEQQQAGDRAAVPATTRIGVPVYAYSGPVKRIGSLHSVDVHDLGATPLATFEISSSGTAHVQMSGAYAIWKTSSYPGRQATHAPASHRDERPAGVVETGKLPAIPVLPDSRRRIPLALTENLAPGRYILDINGDLSGTPLDLGIPFIVRATEHQRRASK